MILAWNFANTKTHLVTVFLSIADPTVERQKKFNDQKRMRKCVFFLLRNIFFAVCCIVIMFDFIWSFIIWIETDERYKKMCWFFKFYNGGASSCGQQEIFIMFYIKFLNRYKRQLAPFFFKFVCHFSIHSINWPFYDRSHKIHFIFFYCWIKCVWHW